MNKNIDQLLIKVILKGDVSGTLPVFNYNYNILNKNISKGGNIYLPNEIDLTLQLFKTKDLKNKEILKKIRENFTSEEAVKNLYKEYDDKLKLTNNELIKRNLEFIINLFFTKKEDFYLDGRKFKINSLTNLTPSDKNYLKKFTSKTLLLSKSCAKNYFLETKHCSLDDDIKENCSIINIQKKLIEIYKKEEIELLKKDSSLKEIEIKEKAYNEAIKKYKKNNENDQIKKFANKIIEMHNNDISNNKQSKIKYIYDNTKGIVSDIVDKCTIENLENMLIESYKEKELKFIKKIDPTLSDDEVDKKAYKEAIEKYKKGNQNDLIKNFANEIIQKENYKNDFKKAGLNYIFNDKRGIILDSKSNLINDIIIEVDLTYSANVVSRKKIHIESGNCKTKKNFIKNLWNKLTRKNKSTSINKDKAKKWIYKKTSQGYKLELAKS